MSRATSTVSVLLCTRNGDRYLAEQLNSIVSPAGWNCQIYASDDASTDSTTDVLEAFASAGAYPLSLRAGPCRGAAANFLSLICDAAIPGDVFAYCDQDDLWSSDKLTRAINALSPLDRDTPALYCARTRTVDEHGRSVGLSPAFRRAPSFTNALIHNIGGGNTMVMNTSARNLLLQAGVVDVVAHDWWTYLLVAGAGGTVIYDDEPALHYRQHGGNEVGANTGLQAGIRRYKKALGGTNREWNSRNIAALNSCRALLTKENRALLDDFASMRGSGLARRLLTLRRAGFYAQTTKGNIGLVLATLLKKL